MNGRAGSNHANNLSETLVMFPSEKKSCIAKRQRSIKCWNYFHIDKETERLFQTCNYMYSKHANVPTEINEALLPAVPGPC